MRAKIYKATYDGDTAYQAIVDAKGNLHIADDQSNSDKVISVPAKRAKKIIKEWQAIEAYGYGDTEINAARHWILAREFVYEGRL